MNTQLAKIYIDRIKDLVFVDQTSLAGVVRRLEKVDVASDGKPFSNYYPIGCTLDYQACQDPDKYTYLVPNHKKKSVIFFEDRGCTLVERTSHGYKFRSTMVLVVWLNGKYFDNAGCYISGTVAINLIDTIVGNGLFNDPQGMFFNIKPKVRLQFAKDANIFSRYSFKEPITQYLLHPYDYLALLIETEFETSIDCVPDITITDPAC